MKRKEEAVWERLEGESADAYAAFTLYRDMAYQKINDEGQTVPCDLPLTHRSIRAVAEKIGKNKRNISNYSVEWNWVERAEAYDRFVDAEALKKAVASIADMRVRHIKLAKVMQAKGAEALKKKKAGDILTKDAIRLLTEGMNIEAARAGQEVEAHTPAEHDVNEQETLNRLDEVLAQIMDDATAENTEV